MSSLRLYIDEDSENHALLRAIRQVDIDVVTAGEALMRGTSDPEQLAWPTSSGRVLYSANRRDFSRIHRDMMLSGNTHSGIILLHERWISVGEQARRIRRIAHAISAEDFVDRIEWLTRW